MVKIFEDIPITPHIQEWLEHREKRLMKQIIEGLLNKGYYILITLDWSQLSPHIDMEASMYTASAFVNEEVKIVNADELRELGIEPDEYRKDMLYRLEKWLK